MRTEYQIKTMRLLKNKWSIALLISFKIILGNFAFGQSAGFNTTFAIMSINGGANAYYDLQATTANTDFNGANLGTFNPASQSLVIKGAEHNVYRCGSSDLTSTRLMYRVYLTSGSGGAFSSINVPYTSGSNNGCGGQDQQWSLTGHSLNVLSGLAPGTYTLELYSEATVTNCCGGTVYASNTSNNYKASFTVAGNYVTTNSSSGLAATYSTLSSAITALNAATITSPVVITLYGNETAPAGGYAITATGTSTNTITIQGQSNSTRSIVTAPAQSSGNLFDAIFKLIGSDYVTLQFFDMRELSSNTTTAVATNNKTEFGVLLIGSSATNGSQNNMIRSNTINLGSTSYQNMFGIMSTCTMSSASTTSVTAQNATSAAGMNSNNTFTLNTISNVVYGVAVLTPPTTTTLGNISTTISDNTISIIEASAAPSSYTSWSGTRRSTGIEVRNASGLTITGNTIQQSGAITFALAGVSISAGTTPSSVTYTNTVSTNTITLTNTGTTSLTGIDLGYGISTGTIVASSNNITLNQTASAAVSAAVIGIKANYASATNTSNSNTIVFNQTTSGTGITSSAFTGINLSGAGTTINSLNNTLTVNQTTSSSSAVTSTITGIEATAASTTVNIGSSGNGNTITVKQAVTGSGSYGSGAIRYIDLGTGGHGTANVVSNTLNTTSSTIRSTGNLFVVQCNGTVTALYNIKSNTVNIDRIATSGSVAFTNQTGTPSNVADTVSNNSITFTNLAGTTSVTAISQLGGPSGSSVKNICNNIISISGTNTGTSRGITWGYSTGAKIFNNSITISNAAPTQIAIDGSGTTAGASGTGGITLNTISLTSSTTSPTSMIGINCASTGPYLVYNNNFTTLNFSGIITGSPIVSGIALSVASGNQIYSNTIKNISVGAATSTANPIVDGILISGGTSTNVYNNSIYGITSNCTGATGTVNGIRISGGTTNTVYNNRIGELTASASTNADGVRGISLTSTSTSTTQNIYYNTINLTGTSSGATFGSSGIFHTASTTSTTSALDLRNNNIINLMTPKGSALAVAYRRNTTDNANYSTNSNNNNFFGTSGLFTNGTNTITDLASYKSYMSTRDQASQNVNPTFLSTSGASSNFLKIDPNASTIGIEGAGQNIATYTTDFEGETRNGTTPDIGADEFATVYACATTPSPANSATAVAQTATLSWTAAVNATSYDVYFGTDLAATNIVNGTNQVGTTYTPSTILSPSTTYYWKIIPKNGSNAATGCATWSFTTDAAVPALTPTSLTAFGSVCTSTTATNTFSMTAVNLTGTFVTITAPSGYTVSEDNVTFASSINVNHSSGSFTSKIIYVKFAPSSASSFSGNVVINGGGLSTDVNVAASGTGIVVVSGLSYSSNPVVYCTTLAATSNTPTLSVSSGVVSYGSSSSLPSGLSLNSSTGVISGTPTATSVATDYTINASNACGSTSAIVNIAVVARLTSLTYTSSTITACAGNAITTNTVSAVTAGSGTLTYSVSPALPTGLSIDATTGAISGTSSSIQASTPYTITVSNGCSSTTATVNIAINSTFNGTYSVGAGQTYTTLTAAVAAYNSSCVDGPVVFNLTDATYSTSETFPITINANTGANSTNTLTIKPASGVTATITGSNSTALIRLNGADYVIIDGSNNGTSSRNLTINNTNTSTPTGVLISTLGAGLGSTFSTVKNTIFTSGIPSTSSFGISVGGSSAGSTGADNDNITLENNNFTTNISTGIYVSGTASTTSGGDDNLTISNNNFTINSSLAIVYAIRVANTLTSTISGNTIDVLTSGSGQPVGISLETGFVSSSVLRNIITQVNTTATGGYGGRGITVGTGTATSALTIANNMISGVNGSNYSSFTNSSSMGICIGTIGNSGTLTTTTGGINLYYNTISMTGNYTYTANCLTASLYVGTGASSLDIRNNIFVNSLNNTSGSGTASKNYAIYSAVANSAYSTIDYNDYVVSGSQGVLAYLTSDRTNLAGIVTGFGQNANSQNITPVFTSSSNLRLVASSNPTLNNLGTTVSVTTDIDGVTRGASPDMGVNEITPPAEDAGITAAVINYCPGSQNVSVTLKNFGLTSLTSATIDWSLNGVAQTPYSWTGSLASGASTSVTVGTYTFVGNTNYVLVTSSSLPNGVADATTGNDSFTSGTFQTGLSGTYTVGAGQDFATLTAAVASANTNGLCGATVFNLTDATYSSSETFPIVLNELAGSSSTNTLTIKPASGVSATITGSNASAILKLNGADYVIIDGSNNGTTSKNLTFENTNTGTTSVVVWVGSASASNGANNVTIKNSIVKGNAPTTTFAAILSSSGTTAGNVAEAANNNLLIQNNSVLEASYGIAAVGNSSYQNGTVITENIIGSNTPTEYIGFRGIFVSNVNAVTVTKNSISNIIVSSSTNVSGIEVTGGVINGTISSNTISNIKSTSTSGYGAYGINFSSATGTTGVLVSNNMISGIETANYSTSSTTYNGFGIRIAAAVPSLKFYNNTVSLYGSVSSGSSAGMSADFITTVAVTGLDLRNNIFSNTQNFGVSGSSAYTVYLTSGTTFSEINYNNYYGASGSNTTFRLGYNGSSNVADLTAWRTFTTKDAQSLAIQPIFTSSSDLHLDVSSNSGLNAVGTVLADVPNDIDGETRNVSTPDVGADEFTPLVCSTATGGTATAATPTLCTTGSSVLNATGYSIGAGTTYQWESSTTIGFSSPTNLGSSGSTYIAGATGTITSTTYYRLKVTCSADPTNPAYSNVVTVSVVSAAALTLTPNTSICNGASTSLSVSGANSYTWSPATGLSATTGSSVTANPTVTTTYTVTGLDNNGCSPTAVVTVTVNLTPPAVTAAQSPSVVCAGDVLTLSSSGGSFGTGLTNYLYSASSGTFSPITGGTSVSAIQVDDIITSAVPIGFNFVYKGTTYTNVYPRSIGFLSFYSSSPGQSSASNGLATASSSVAPVVAPLWDDLDGATGTASYTTTGTAGNRVFTFQWLNWEWSYSAGNSVISFQAKLYEADNRIEFVYRPEANPVVSGSASIGITGATGTYLSLDGSGSGPSTSSSTETTSISTKPSNGQVYSFMPPPTISYVWSPTTNLYSDVAGTIAYTGTSTETVYARNTTATTYTITAANGSCTSSNTVVTSINSLPTISSSNEIICYGQTTTLSASGAVSYTWSPGTGLSATTGSSVTANSASTTTYTITGVDANNCQNTTTAIVTVNPVIVITSQPSNAVVLENATANFSVTATGVDLTYQWQESTNSGSSWSNISGANSATYSYTNVPLSANGYQYRCVVGGSPCADVTSNAVTLTISNTAIVTQPTNQTICSSDNAVFSITTSGTTPTYQWQVSINSGLSWSDISGETNSTLTLSGLTSTSTSNQYRCVLSGSINSDPALLTVYNVPTITSQPTNLTVCSNDVSGGFSATATGSNLTYQWQLSTNGGSSWANIDAETNPSLSFNSFTNSMDGYKYRLVVSGTSPCSSVNSNVVTLSVTGANASVDLATICLNESINLTATPTSSSSGLTYSWSSGAGSGASTPVSGSPASITPTVAGTYTYTLSTTGMSCSTTSTVNVTINALPSITTATATSPICAGGTINLVASSVSSSTGTATLGNGSTQGNNNTTFVRVGNTVGNQFKNQYLFTAAELTAAGLTTGNITSLTFDVFVSGGGTVSNLTFRLGTTALTALTSTYVTGLTQVYTIGTYPTTGVLQVGLQTVNFNTPYYWDGTSNLVLEACSQLATLGSAGDLRSGTTSFVSTITNNPTSTACASTTGLGTSSVRPNFRFEGQIGSNVTSSLNWSWNSSPAVNTATGTTVAVNNTTSPITTNYTVTATNPTTGCINSLTTSDVTINPVPAVPTATNTSICGTQNATCSVTGSGLGGNSFRWYTVSSGGTAIAGQTGSSLTAYPVATTTIFYVSETNGNCESERVAVTQTVTSAPSISASASPTTVCSGSPTTLTASSSNPDYTYTWSNSLGTGSSVVATPTSTTTFTVNASDINGCTNSNTVIVTVNPIPTSIVASANSNVICSGQSLSLTATANSNFSTNQVLLNPSVEGGFESGSTFTANGWVGITSGARTFRVGTVTTPYAGTNSVYVGSTTANNGINNSAVHHFYRDVVIPANSSNISLRFYLSLPSIDISGATIYDYLNVYTTTTGNTPVVGTVPSTNYTLLSQFGGTVISGYTLQTLPISNSLSGTTVRVVFSWRSDGVTPHVAPIIDNIGITADVSTTPTFTWTSTPSGFTSSLQNPTSFVPTATTRYNLTVANNHGCSDTSSVLVTVNTPSTAASSANASSSTVCSGELVTLTQTGGSLGTSATWKWYSDAAYITLIGSSSSTNASLDVNPLVSTTYYLRAEGTASPCTSNVPSGNTAVTISMPTLTVSLVDGDYVWLGSNSDDWATANNWRQWTQATTSYSVPATSPNSTTNSVILPGTSTCVLNDVKLNNTTTSVKDLVIGAGRTITLNHASAVLNVSGAISNSGTWSIPVSGSTVNFNASGSQTIAALDYSNLQTSGSGSKTLDGDLTVGQVVTIGSGTTLALGTRTLSLPYVGTPLVLSGALDAGTGTVLYNGSGAQNLASASYYNLKTAGSGNKTLGGSTTVTNELNLEEGTLIVDANTLTFNGNSVLRNNGVIDASNSNATLAFGNSSTLTLPTNIFSAAINNLTLNNARVKASSDFTVNGVLNLNSLNPDPTNGLLDLVQSYGGYADVHSANSTDANNNLNAVILTLGSAATVSGTGDVTGKIRRTSFADGQTYAFGNPNMKMTFNQNGGTLPTQITVVATLGDEGIHVDKDGINDFTPGTSDTLIGGAPVRRMYQILRTGGTNNVRFTVRFPYLQDELNANNETDLVTWDHHIPYAGMTPHEHGKTSQNTSENWVELSNHGIGYLATEGDASFTKYWMLSKKITRDTIWLGAAGGSAGEDWSTSINWSSGVVPSSWTKIVVDPNVYKSELTITDSQEAATILIKPGGVVNGGTGTLTLNGGPAINGGSGTWVNNGTFIPGTSHIIINNSDATMSGTSNFYDLTINDGKKLTIQSSASDTITGTLTIDGSGILDATSNSNTIVFAGNDQVIPTPNGAIPGYYNLTINQNSGTATAIAQITTLGNLVVENGTLDLQGNSAFIEGNLINNDAIANAVELYMSGTGNQSIGGSNPITTELLLINGASGTTTINQDVTVNQVLFVEGAKTLNGGDHEIKLAGSAQPFILEGTFDAGTGTVNYTSVDPTDILPITYFNLKSEGAVTKVLMGSTNVENTLTLDGTLLDVDAHTLSIGNSPVTLNSGTLKVDAGTLELTNSSSMTIPASIIEGSTFNNLILTGVGGTTLSNDMTLAGDLVLSSGNLNLGSTTLTFETNSTMTGTSGLINTGTGGFVFKAGGLDVSLLASTDISKLEVNRASGTVEMNNGNLNVTNTFTLTDGTFDINANELRLSGAIVHSGGDLDVDAGTIDFNNTGAYTLSSGLFNGNVYKFKASGAGDLTLSDPVKVSNALTMSGGDINTSSGGLLEIGLSTSTVGSITWNSGTVVGPLRRWFAASTNSSQASGIFPVGTADFNRYAQINFTEAPEGGYLDIEYKDGLAPDSYDNLPLAFNENNANKYIQNADEEGYWEMKPYNSTGTLYGALDSYKYDLLLRINNPTSVQNGGILNNPPGVRLIRAKGYSNGTHGDWEMAGTYQTAIQLAEFEDYVIKSVDVQGFSWFNGGGDNSNPLPIELLSFAGNCQGNQVSISWITASEFNNDYFIIEKSRDGNNWQTIHTEKSSGTSFQKQEYNFIDENLTETESYYRLSQVDIDGVKEVFDPIYTDCDGSIKQLITYPNPSRGEFNVLISDSKFIGEAKLIVRDAMGKVVLTKSITIEEGTNLFPIAANEIENGVYFITIENANNDSETIKHVKN